MTNTVSDNYDGDTLTKQIIEAIIKVHQTLGPGFLESIYRNALVLELGSRDFEVQSECEVVVYYDNKPVGRHRLDLVVNNTVILELKTVEDLCSAHYAQLRSYLKALASKTGLLVNFSKDKADFRRIELK